MAALPAPLTDTADRAEFCRAPHRGGVELCRAYIVRHDFEPHSHDAFGREVVEQEEERLRYRGGEHLAGHGALVTMQRTPGAPRRPRAGAAARSAGTRRRWRSSAATLAGPCIPIRASLPPAPSSPSPPG